MTWTVFGKGVIPDLPVEKPYEEDGAPDLAGESIKSHLPKSAQDLIRKILSELKENTEEVGE